MLVPQGYGVLLPQPTPVITNAGAAGLQGSFAEQLTLTLTALLSLAMESFKEMVPRAHQPIAHRSVARFRTPTLLVALVLVASAPLLQAQPPGSVPFDAPFTSSEELLEQAAYTVAQCFIGGVIVQSTAPDPILPAIGNFFLNSADAVTDTEVLCTDCGQFGAIVTGVGEPQACASGATPCIEVQLTTRPALPQEVLTPEALQILNLSESGDVPLFAAVSEGCEAESGRRLAGAWRMVLAWLGCVEAHICLFELPRRVSILCAQAVCGKMWRYLPASIRLCLHAYIHTGLGVVR